jgi:hypothetical protein
MLMQKCLVYKSMEKENCCVLLMLTTSWIEAHGARGAILKTT